MNTITDYTFTVEDECGNTKETTASVILEDTTPPVLTVPANQTEECGAIALTVTDWLALATVMDDCDALPVISTELWNTISGCGGSYTETYLFTATDDCGNQTTGLADYVIQDTGLPTITSCPVPLVLECGVEANDQIILQWLESAVATDANGCSDVSITHDYPGGLPGACGSPVLSVTFTADGYTSASLA